MPNKELAPLYGLVLAGGKSRRMGMDKASLVYQDNKPQVQRSYELLSQCCDQVYVSLRQDQLIDGWEIEESKIIRDKKDDLGPVSGIYSAFCKYENVSWLLIACDLPMLDLATLEHLIEHRKLGQDLLAYRSAHDALPEPMCAIYEANSKTIIDRYVSEDLRCPRKILIKEEAFLLDLKNRASLENANHPEEFEKFKRILS